MINVFYCSFSDQDFEQEAISELKDQLPKALTEKAARFHFIEDQYRSLVGKALLSYAHLQTTGNELSWNEYEEEELKKPKLKNGPFFNISHSGRVVTVAMSEGCDVGIDTEELKPIDISKFEENFLPAEWLWLQNTSNKLRNLRFYQLWTRKEAILKATGLGLSLPLTDFNVLGEKVKVQSQDWHLLNLRLDKSSVTHLATKRGVYDPAELSIQKCELADLIYGRLVLK